MAKAAGRRRRWPWVLGTLAALGVIAFWVLFLPPFHVTEIFAEPEFCGSCHNMEPELRAFQASSHQALDSCNDCHLPNGNVVEHYVWDAYVGSRDLVSFYILGRAPYDTEATDRSKGWIQDNCIRCHGDVVERMFVEENCWECHRELYHRFQLTRVQGEDVWNAE